MMDMKAIFPNSMCDYAALSFPCGGQALQSLLAKAAFQCTTTILLPDLVTKPNTVIETLVLQKRNLMTSHAPTRASVDTLVPREGNGVRIEGFHSAQGQILLPESSITSSRESFACQFTIARHAFAPGGDYHDILFKKSHFPMNRLIDSR
jgi:hypothetical protein